MAEQMKINGGVFFKVIKDFNYGVKVKPTKKWYVQM